MASALFTNSSNILHISIHNYSQNLSPPLLYILLLSLHLLLNNSIHKKVLSPDTRHILCQHTLTATLRNHLPTCLLLRREDTPKPQRFVAGSRDNRAAVGVHCEEEHAACVAGQGRHFGHFRAFPDVHLVQRVAVRAHKLVNGFAEN